MRNFILFIFFLLPLSLFSQQSDAEIQIVHFNSNVSYASGSSISVHINPKGLYDINNEFSLEISNVGEDFTSGSTTIKTIEDFYIPLMTASLPDNLDPGQYKLRIRASLGLQAGGDLTDSNDYSDILSSELDLTLVDSQSISETTISSTVITNDNFFNCLSSNTLPRIGSNKAASNSKLLSK